MLFNLTRQMKPNSNANKHRFRRFGFIVINIYNPAKSNIADEVSLTQFTPNHVYKLYKVKSRENRIGAAYDVIQ